MNEWPLRLGFFVSSVAVLVMGVLALVLSPKKYARLLAWWSGMRTLPETDSATETKPRLDLSRRVAGLAVALMGVGLMQAAVQWLGKPTVPVPTKPKLAVPTEAAREWYAYGAGVVIFLVGLYALLQPEPVLEWSIRKLPFKPEPSPSTARVQSLAIRVMGAIMMYASLSLLGP